MYFNEDVDTLQKFMVEGVAVRGELVEISNSWQQMQARHDYPRAVQTLLGEMVAAAALLSANLKFDGMLIMQIHGDGPVRLLVVECDSKLTLRATAKLAPDMPIADDARLPELVNMHGKGRFVITLDPLEKLPGQQAYQGIVPLDGDDVASVIENYMQRSEQLDTRLWIAADQQVARGLLLQKLPQSGGLRASQGVALRADDEDNETETWNRIVMLAATLKKPELLDTDIATLMRRLFWEETIRVFSPQHPHFHCSCTREKVGNMLKLLGPGEIDSALAECEPLGIDCDFCGQHYEFDRVDCAQLFAGNTPVEILIPASDAKH